jgi:hypothetical protein
VELLEELRGYPGGGPAPPAPPGETGALIAPLRYRTPVGVLSLFSATTVFGTPRDVTVSELAIETFYPADTATGTVLRSLLPQSEG